MVDEPDLQHFEAIAAGDRGRAVTSWAPADGGREPRCATGILVALPREARALVPTLSTLEPGADRLFRLPDSLLAVSGMGWEPALAAARRLVEAGAIALASVGTAGALDPALASGDIVLPEAVVTLEGAVRAAHLPWCRALVAALPRGEAHAGRLLTSRLPVGLRLDKIIARRETACVAVDMESAAVAEVAAEHRLPFVAVRVIVDIAGEDLPRAVLAASGAGTVSTARVLAGIARAPWELAALARLAGRFRTACGVLAEIGEPGLPARQALTAGHWERTS